MLDKPSLSFITTCKGRLQHLMQTLPKMAAQPGTETIVVDYDCPDHSGDWVAANFPAVRVVRVRDQPIFNAARARNLGAATAVAPWLCFVDADTLLHPDFAANVLAVASPGVYCQGVHGRHELVGTIALSQAAFALVQGYDEVMQGWGAEDADLYNRLQRTGQRRVDLPVHLLDTIKHGSDLRTRFHRIDNQISSWTINQMYLELKYGIQSLTGKEAPTEIRRRIYTDIEAEVLAAQAARRTASYTLSSGWCRFIPNHQVERILTVRVRPGPSGIPGNSD
jgi:glycosyltransferase involved in cell wall biosynthesis